MGPHTIYSICPSEFYLRNCMGGNLTFLVESCMGRNLTFLVRCGPEWPDLASVQGYVKNSQESLYVKYMHVCLSLFFLYYMHCLVIGFMFFNLIWCFFILPCFQNAPNFHSLIVLNLLSSDLHWNCPGSLTNFTFWWYMLTNF